MAGDRLSEVKGVHPRRNRRLRDDELPKGENDGGRTASGCRKVGRNLLFRFLYFAFRHSQSLQSLSSSFPPAIPSPLHLCPVFFQYLALVSLCSPFPSHRNDNIQSSALARPKDSTLPVETLPHPIRLQCLPIQIPPRPLRRCHLDGSRTGTQIDIVLPPCLAWPLNKMWKSRMTWPEVCICSNAISSPQGSVVKYYR